MHFKVPDDVLRHVCGYCVGSLRELFSLYLVNKHFRHALAKASDVVAFRSELGQPFGLA